MGKSDLASLVMDCKNKFDTALNNTNSELPGLKTKFIKLKSGLKIFRNVNNKLVDAVAKLERKWWDEEMCSRRERIEISEIPQIIEQIDLEKTVLTVFEK